MVEDQSPNEKILEQLALMNKLLGVLVSSNMQDAGMTMAEQVRIMARVGLTPSEIAAILGTAPHNVSSALYSSRKGPAKRAQKHST